MNKTIIELDTLKELASIGEGNSAKSLSMLTKEKIDIKIPNVSVLKLEEIAKNYNLDETIKTAVVLKVNHQIDGVFLLLMSPPDSESLARLINNNHLQFDKISILKELGNILCGTAINSLSNFLHLDISQSVPDINEDMGKAVMESIASQLGEDHQEVLIFETGFKIANINLDIYYLFDPDSTVNILKLASKKI